MRLWRVVVLLNVALAAGVLLGWLAWGQRIPGLERLLRESERRVVVVGVEQTWVVRGVVRAVIPESQTIVLTHDEIPGYMPAGMTMGFKAAGPKILDGARVGDVVRVTLRGVPPDVQIVSLVKEGQS